MFNQTTELNQLTHTQNLDVNHPMYGIPMSVVIFNVIINLIFLACCWIIPYYVTLYFMRRQIQALNQTPPNSQDEMRPQSHNRRKKEKSKINLLECQFLERLYLKRIGEAARKGIFVRSVCREDAIYVTRAQYCSALRSRISLLEWKMEKKMFNRYTYVYNSRLIKKYFPNPFSDVMNTHLHVLNQIRQVSFLPVRTISRLPETFRPQSENIGETKKVRFHRIVRTMFCEHCGLRTGGRPFQTLPESRICCSPVHVWHNKNFLNDEDVHVLRHQALHSVPQVVENLVSHVVGTGALLNYTAKLIEDLLIFVALLLKAQDYESVSLAFACFAKFRFGADESLFSKFMEGYANIFPLRQQSKNPQISTLRELLDKYHAIKDSEFFSRIHNMFVYCLTFNLFSKAGITFDSVRFEKVQVEAARRTHSSPLGFLESLADLVVFLCEKGHQIYITGDVECIFHSASKYGEWYDDVEWLREHYIQLDDAESFGFSFAEFYEKLSSAIERGDSIRKHALGLSRFDERSIQAMLAQLKMYKAEIDTSSNARKTRKTPFSILLFGDTGVGKSTLLEILFSQYGKLRNLPVEDKMKYTRNASAKFWDGYVPSQWCTVLDDVAFMNPKIATSGDPSVLEFLQIVNAVPFCPDQADLARKGKTPFKSEFVMATSNVKGLNALQYFQHPSAAQRRFPWVITPKVREEYRKGFMLDSSKITEGEPADYWTFTVERVETRRVANKENDAIGANCLYTPILEDASLYEFLRWFNGAVEEHWQNQGKVDHSIRGIHNMPLCSCHKMLQSYCPKLKQQSLNVPVVLGIFAILYMVLRDLFVVLMLIRLKERICTSFQNLKKKIRGFLSPSSYVLESRSYWTNMGNRVEKKFKRPQFLVKLAAAITVGCGMLTLMKILMASRRLDLQAEEKRFTPPVPKTSEKNNPWYTSEFDLKKTEISDASSALFGSTDVLEKKIEANMFVGETMCNGDHKRTRWLGIGGHVYVTNSHAVPYDDFQLRIVQSSFANGVNRNMTVKMSPNDVVRILDRDLAFVYLRHLPPRKDISKYFVPEDYEVQSRGVYVTMGIDGTFGRNPVRQIQKMKRLLSDGSEFLGFYGRSEVLTRDGDCGTPLLLDTPRGPAIAGIHTYGSEAHGVGTSVLSQEVITKVWKEFPKTDVSPIEIGSDSVKRDIGPLHVKSTFRYIEEGTANVIGSFTGFRPQPKSNVGKTLLHEEFVAQGYTEKYTRPRMRGYQPWRIAALDLVNPVTQLDQAVIEKCVEGLTRDILNSLPEGELDDVKPYDRFTAVNGAPGVAYVDAMKRGTSMGLPYRKKKIKFMNALPSQRGVQDPVEFNEEINQRIDRLLEIYSKGKRANPIFNACLKDEPVTHKKAKMGKTRVFSSAPADFSVVVRMYLLSFVRLVQNNKYVFESCPGTVCQSKEWGEMYEFLTFFGEHRMIAGDFKAFDKRMAAIILEAAFDVIINVLRASGNYTEEDLEAVRAIGEDVRFPLTDFNGDLVEFLGSNPSGWPLTVIINGLVNALYMRYVYVLANPENECDDFKDNVHLLTYGDDNIMGVSPNCPWFNHTQIQEILGEVDIVYTMADKEAESVPFIHINDCSFLKRSWRFDDVIGDYLCPLEHDSIEKMLLTWTRSKTVYAEEQMCAILDSALQEYFHYGREVFEKKRQLFDQLVVKHKLEDYLVRPLPQYEMLVENWHEASK